jgi:hypothetical protein
MNSILYESDFGNHTVYYDEQTLSINLSGRGIAKIVRINGLSDLQILRMNDNQLSLIEGLDGLTNLRELHLYNNKIERIEGLDGLTNLRELHLYNNKIERIEGLDGLTSLRKLYLDNNMIYRIEGLDRLTGLTELTLGGNQIERIEGLDGLINLIELSLGGSRIDRIEGSDKLISLQILDLSDCHIHQIEGLGNLTNLQELYLYGNPIERIEGLDGLTGLQLINLENTQIKEVPSTIMNLRNLTYLHVGNNVQINPIIRRFLTRTQIETKRTIYNDPQNVHDSQIHRSISGSLYRLMENSDAVSNDQVVQEIIDDPILTQQTKQQIVEYTKIDDVHSLLNVTFMEALRYVWQAIRSHEQADSIKKVLDQEMQDSICRCFTGRLSRLVNCLSGFDDRVEIRISSDQEIANLIISVKQKYDNLEQQIKMVREEMTERGYDQQTVDLWIGYLE